MRSFFGFTFLDILYFSKYFCTNMFHRRSLYTFYQSNETSTDIKDSKFVDHLYIDWPLAKQNMLQRLVSRDYPTETNICI